MKKTFIALIIILIAFLISSCLNFEQVTTIKKDLSGRMFVHFWGKSYLSPDTLFYNTLGLFNRDSLLKNFEYPFLNIDNIEVYSISEDSTIHSKVEFEFVHIDSLNSTKIFKGAKFKVENAPGGIQVFTHFVPQFVTGLGINTDKIQIEYVYYLPGKILNHNADEIYSNKLSWHLKASDLDQPYVLTASYVPYKLKETPKWIYYLALFVIFLVLFYIVRKR